MHAPPSLVGRIVALIFAILGAGRLGLGIYAYRAANALERPSYEVIRRLASGIELRRYQPYVIAETEVKAASMREAGGTGFRTVAGYIFGKNKPRKKMSMTAPVRISSNGGEAMKMTAPVRMERAEEKTRVSFVLEKQYSTRTAPTPFSREVRVRNVAPHILAASRFSGPPPSERRIARERARILEAMEASGLQPSASAMGGETLVYGYHDPFITPSFLRRNEVCVRVSDSAAISALC